MKYLLFFLVFSPPSFADTPFYQVADRLFEDTWNQLYRCGLRRMDAYDPRLPKPKVSARDAVVNNRLNVLAYTDEESWGQSSRTLTFKATNGGSRHDLISSRDSFSATVPFRGTIARAERVMTATGPVVHLYAGSNPNPVGQDYWNEYLAVNYRDQLADEFCRKP